MKSISLKIPDVKLLTPTVFSDSRGFFLESYNHKTFSKIGIPDIFVQDNHSYSLQGVLRGLHFQLHTPQAKLVRVVRGEIFDVVVDLRENSSTYGQWVGEILSSENFKMLWVPPQFAHGFLTLSEFADVLYKTTEYYDPTSERTLRWNDPNVAIDWPLRSSLNLSAKDQQGQSLADLEKFL